MIVVPEIVVCIPTRLFVLPRLGELSDTVREEAAAQLLRKLPSIADKNRGFVEELRTTSFVTAASGVLQPPSALYDPRCALSALHYAGFRSS